MAKTSHTPPMQELLALPPEELALRAQAQRQELTRSRFAHASGRLQKTHTLRVQRRQLARILTAHRQLQNSKPGTAS